MSASPRYANRRAGRGLEQQTLFFIQQGCLHIAIRVPAGLSIDKAHAVQHAVAYKEMTAAALPGIRSIADIQAAEPGRNAALGDQRRFGTFIADRKEVTDLPEFRVFSAVIMFRTGR